MSCFGLKKHLLPSKKAWKSFTSALGTKLQKLRRSRPIKRATAAASAVLRRKPQPPHSRHVVHARRLGQHLSFTPVYIDELFDQPSEAHVEHLAPRPQPSGTKVFDMISMKEAVGIGCSSSSSTMPREMGEVDLRAELFIARFREEMRLQRQRSFGEYQEMLARGI